MTKWGMSPDVFDRQNYYRLLTVMSAKDAKDRVQDPASIVPTNALGQAPKGIMSLDEFAKIKQKGGK